MPFYFEDYFFRLLPGYYKVNDTYKDLSDKGVLERFLTIFGEELDDELVDQADEYLNIVDPLHPDAEPYLTNLAYTLGSPPDLFGDPAKYAKLLSFIVSVYKIKGTKRSYELFFALLGYNVQIIEYDPEQPFLFDSGHFFDDGDDNPLTDEDPSLFDQGCAKCSDYDLIFSPSGDDCTVPEITIPSQTTIDQLLKVVAFNEPINAHLRDLVAGAPICEGVSYCGQDQVTLGLVQALILDGGFIFDDGELMDSPVLVSSSTITQDCDLIPSGIGAMIIESTFIVG